MKNRSALKFPFDDLLEIFKKEEFNPFSYDRISNKRINLNILEIYENSIITKGFSLENYEKPSEIIFKNKHSRRKVRVTDSLITPEIAIFYVNKDTRKWPHSKRCFLVTIVDFKSNSYN